MGNFQFFSIYQSYYIQSFSRSTMKFISIMLPLSAFSCLLLLHLSTRSVMAQRWNDCKKVPDGGSCIKNPDKCRSPSCRRSKCWRGNCLTKRKYEIARKDEKDNRKFWNKAVWA